MAEIVIQINDTLAEFLNRYAGVARLVVDEGRKSMQSETEENTGFVCILARSIPYKDDQGRMVFLAVADKITGLAANHCARPESGEGD